jgi:KUP system potassium uptake protein
VNTEGSIPENPPTHQEEGQIPATTAEGEGPLHGRRLAVTTLSALGVVYGDIGTSPLYALRECFSGQYGVRVNDANVLGVLSLILWGLFFVISIKYIALVMQADNRGEGGILALMALVQSKGKLSDKTQSVLAALGIFGAALLYGDGMITPAISVLSAVEGIKVATPALDRYVISITVAILIGLFFFQKRGTAMVGSVFGPVILIWFLVIGFLGLAQIVRAPRVLLAILPVYAANFTRDSTAGAFFVLGAVFLVVTGGEALYADMGHFGKRPIRSGWFSVVLPALMLNYMGQGALLLRDSSAVRNPFYHLAPGWALYPLVALATAATVIASQAVISGSFSLARQAVHLGYSPRMRIEHTSVEEAGQVYVGSVNWVLFAATVGLVTGFGSSSALAGAYGVAVSTTMVITTLLLYRVARNIWGWSIASAGAVTAALLCVDLAFFSANIIKISKGGWFPLLVAGIVFILMTTWRRGRELLRRRFEESDLPLENFLKDLDTYSLSMAKGTAVFLTANPQGTPLALLHNIKHNQVLHEQVVLLTISTRNVPYVPYREFLNIENLSHGFWRIHAVYGFMQSPSVPRIFALARREGLEMDLRQATFFLSRMIPVATPKKPGMALWRERLFAVMNRNGQRVTTYFDIPADRVIEIGAEVGI